nr:DUF1707 and FHA domain-containing protein [Streptomyces sp. WAC 06738]
MSGSDHPTSSSFPLYPAGTPRVSDEERDRAIELLRDGAAEGRLSQDTFLARVDLAFAAHSHEQLAALTADLPPREGRLTRAILGTVAKASSLGVRVKQAWQAERLPPLMLPAPGTLPLRIGRDPRNGLRLMEETVSRMHAELRCASGVWLLRDLGSTNGTFINGRRLTGEAPVRPGDQLGFGHTRYLLTAR